MLLLLLLLVSRLLRFADDELLLLLLLVLLLVLLLLLVEVAYDEAAEDDEVSDNEGTALTVAAFAVDPVLLLATLLEPINTRPPLLPAATLRLAELLLLLVL